MDSISNFFSSFDKVFCLSLKNADDRRAHIRSLSAQYDIRNLEFIDAINGDNAMVEQFYRDGLVKKYPNCFRCGKMECGDEQCNNTLIPVQVATFLSYLNIWRKIVDRDLRAVMIIEDDIKLAPRAEQHCARIVSERLLHKSGIFGLDPMLLRFGWALCPDHEVDESFHFRSIVKMSNPAHAINLGMAKHLNSKFKKIETTVDIFQHRNCANEENSKTGYPPLFYEMSWSTGEVDSHIHPKKIRLEYLRGVGKSDDSQYRRVERALKSHRMHTLYRNILAVGHPRCGSGYTAKLLQSAGMAVGHEAMESDGISSWMFAVYDDHNPYYFDDLAKSRLFTYFKHLVVHVRDPRTAIPSIINENLYSSESYKFRRKHILDQNQVDLDGFHCEVERAAASLINWTDIIARQEPDLIYRIEDQATELMIFLKQQAMSTKTLEEVALPSKKTNSDKPYKGIVYPKPMITKDDILKIDKVLLARLNEYCVTYGYKPI